MRTGKNYLDWIKLAPLKINYKGATIHPLKVEKFRHQALVIADYYDHHHSVSENTVQTDIGSHSVTLLIPRTKDDLRRKSDGFYSLARNYFGVVGRSPDYMNSVVSCWAGSSDLFDEYQQNVFAFYERVLKEDLFVTHSTSELRGGVQSGVRVVEERDDGIVLSGARAMATSAALCDEILIAPTRLTEKEKDRMIVCVISSISDGLKLVCRNTEESSSDLGRFYDESDALVVLDKVFVPWEKVFIYRDVELYSSIVKKTGTSLAASLQTNARAIAKLESIVSLLSTWQDIYPNYRTAQFGEIAGRTYRDIQILKALQRQAIEEGQKVHRCMQPNDETIEAAKLYFMERYHKVVSELRSELGPDLFYLFNTNEMSSVLVDELCSQWGISKESLETRQRISVVLFEMIVSTFGIRQELYEQFNAGRPPNAIANYWKNYSKKTREFCMFDKFEQMGALYHESFGPSTQ